MADSTQSPTMQGAPVNLDALVREVLARLAVQGAGVVPVPGNGYPARPAGLPSAAAAGGPESRAAVVSGKREILVPIGISNRHMHLCREDVDRLFGEGYELKPFKDLYQPGYYAAQERVLVVGKRRCVEDVRILGPLRPRSQVELSQTDAILVGLSLGVAESGTDPISQPILLVGPKGQVLLPGGAGGGAYIARRHVHLDPADAAALGAREGDLVDCVIDGARSTTYHGVLVRLKQGWLAEIHLDTDEANASGVRNGQMVRLVMPARL
jgi:putative phosphotransacetylase